jgi:hypothetical protein
MKATAVAARLDRDRNAVALRERKATEGSVVRVMLVPQDADRNLLRAEPETLLGIETPRANPW